MRNRILSVLLAFAVLLSLIPAALAADIEREVGPSESEMTQYADISAKENPEEDVGIAREDTSLEEESDKNEHDGHDMKEGEVSEELTGCLETYNASQSPVSSVSIDPVTVVEGCTYDESETFLDPKTMSFVSRLYPAYWISINAISSGNARRALCLSGILRFSDP